jgi:tRNA pseudouridine65 synthase
VILCVVHRDAHCIVVDKPAGVVVHRGWANDDVDLMRSVRDLVGHRVHPLHRLDRGTSGAVVFGLTHEFTTAASRAFAEHRVEKRYLALTRGHPPLEGMIDHPVPKAPGGERVSAQTRYRRLGVAGRYALVECVPLTGRLHQIRRHMKHLSCPLIGDVRYGKGEHNRLFRERYALNRLALHAHRLAFDNPPAGTRLELSVPVSGTLRSCLALLDLLGAAEASTG